MPITPNPKPASPLDDEQQIRRAAAESAAAILVEYATTVTTEDIIDLADYIVRGWITDADIDDELDDDFGVIVEEPVDAAAEQEELNRFSQPVDLTEPHNFLPAEEAPGASYIGANTLDAQP